MATLTQQQFDPASAWARYEPDVRRPWNFALVGHLYRRAALPAQRLPAQRQVQAGRQKANS